MNSSQRHPSFLELDRLHLGVGSEATRVHVEACARCSGHLSRLTLGSASAEVPQALREKALGHSTRWSWGRTVWLGAALASMVVTGVVTGVVGRDGGESLDEIRAKAAQPAVALFIKRGERVLQWDGQTPIRPGDRLRLEVAPEGFRRVKVTTPQAGASTVLYEGELGSQTSALLPLSFQVDANGDAEVLHILLSAGHDPKATWSTRLVLEKWPSADGGGDR